MAIPASSFRAFTTSHAGSRSKRNDIPRQTIAAARCRQ
ncbi:Hypothetical protein A7982_02757 [Minicystis rosea]|nr:Hypothetical protein A7982_02757 [Minicystis rosea]